ncbi:MAG TPA: methyltransferase domain-containing protein [Actinomycetota bacterium]
MSTDPLELHARIREFWDQDAAVYDNSPSHAVSHPSIQAAWRATLSRLLPPAPARVLDVGAGTGAIALLAAEFGHRVTAFDLSPGMLAETSRKAAERGLDVEAIVGAAVEPPTGPFDVVIERHLLWTLPDPGQALMRWRDAAPKGRLVLLEGIWGGSGPLHDLRERATRLVRQALDVPHEHHGAYDPEVLASLPLAGRMAPDLAILAAEEAGWRQVRLHRLHDVEWATRLASHPLLGWLEHRPRFAVVADA